MKKAVLMGFAVFFMMAGEAMGGWWWSPSDVEIVPQHPTSCDVVVITLSGAWGDTCMPYDSTVSVVGNDIYLDVIWPDVSCLPMVTSWEWTESVGPLSVGTYTVYARLIGYPQIPEEYTQMTEFTVTGQIIYVDVDARGANDGSSWANAYNYLQDALAVANSISVPVEIRVAEGVYKPDSNSANPDGSGDRTATFQLINSVAIRGGYAGFGEPDADERDIDEYETILSGDLYGNDVDVNDPADLWRAPSRAENSYQVVTGSGTDRYTVLDGFTIAGGNANGGWSAFMGGGMYNEQGSPTVINCTFNYNSAGDGPIGAGGGMCNIRAHPMLVNCIFSSNSTVWSGGGMANYDNSSPTLTNCTFSGNSACYGGGMCNWDASPTLANCTFSDNRTTRYCSWLLCLGGEGGGMDNNGHSSPMLTNCTFSGNSAYHGGGMSNYDNSTAMLTNCTLSGNSAGNSGGAIYNRGYLNQITLTLDNCTFAGNSALNGNALACDSSRQRWPSNVELNNCILRNGGNKIWNNDGSTVGITYSDVQGGQTEVYDPCEGLVWGLGNIDADPCFAEPGYWADANDPNIVVEPNDPNAVWIDGDYHLLEDSPCIDAGDPNYIAEPNETDLDGNPRIIGGRIDMGAYEYSPPIPAEVRIVPRTINLASKGKWITCYIWLGEDYDVADIDPNSVLLEDGIKAEWFSVDEQQQIAVARFSRSEVQGILAPGEVELSVSGELADGTVFEGTDAIRVIDKGGKK